MIKVLLFLLVTTLRKNGECHGYSIVKPGCIPPRDVGRGFIKHQNIGSTVARLIKTSAKDCWK